MVLMELGVGGERFADAKLPLIDLLHIRNWDENFIYLILTIIIIGIVSAITSIARWMCDNHGMLSAIFYAIAVIVMAVFYIGGMKLAINDYYANSYNGFDFEMEEYEVLQDTNVYIEIDPLLTKPKLFKTGVFKAGSKLYGSRKSTEKDNVVYYQVCDKNHKVGVVSSQDIKPLYEWGYALKEDSTLYGIHKEYRNVVISNGEHMNICSKDITEEIIGTVSAGTIVNKGSFIQNPVTGKNDYCEITLSDGTEGAVPWESLEEIKIPAS